VPITSIEGKKFVTGKFIRLKETVKWQNPRRDTQIPNHPGLKCKASGVHDVKLSDEFAYEIDGADAVLGQAGLVFCQTCYAGLPSEEHVTTTIRKLYKRETITQKGSLLSL